MPSRPKRPRDGGHCSMLRAAQRWHLNYGCTKEAASIGGLVSDPYRHCSHLAPGSAIRPDPASPESRHDERTGHAAPGTRNSPRPSCGRSGPIRAVIPRGRPVRWPRYGTRFRPPAGRKEVHRFLPEMRGMQGTVNGRLRTDVAHCRKGRSRTLPGHGDLERYAEEKRDERRCNRELGDRVHRVHRVLLFEFGHRALTTMPLAGGKSLRRT
jgi:hypothetical protein